MATFGERLRELRKVARLTQKELAHAAGVAESTISMYEMERREPDFETLEVLSDYFNVDVGFLLGRDETITYIPNSRTSGPQSAINIIESPTVNFSFAIKNTVATGATTYFFYCFFKQNTGGINF